MLRKALLLNADQITLDAVLIDDLGLTSRDRFELVMAIEDEFGLEWMGEEQEAIEHGEA